MPRRQWLAAAMLATGSVLVISAQLAGAAPDRRGGIFRVGMTGASVQIDPQLVLHQHGLVARVRDRCEALQLPTRGPKGTLVPEVASRFKVTNGGTRYTFFIRKGFRFSDGTPVTARSFKYAINRAANKDLSSPASQFITDFNGVDIVGAEAVTDGSHDGCARRAGPRQQVDHQSHAKQRRALTVLAMPFFQATSARLPLDREVADVGTCATFLPPGPTRSPSTTSTG